MTNAEVLHQVEHGYRMQIPQGCPPLLYDIMLECWHKVTIQAQGHLAKDNLQIKYFKLDLRSPGAGLFPI